MTRTICLKFGRAFLTRLNAENEGIGLSRGKLTLCLKHPPVGENRSLVARGVCACEQQAARALARIPRTRGRAQALAGVVR